MASKKSKGLGRGLEALLGGSADFAEAPAVKPEQGNSLSLEQLQPGKYQHLYQEKPVNYYPEVKPVSRHNEQAFYLS